MKKVITIYFLIILILSIAFAIPAQARSTLAQKLAGRILLQAESKGEAWYINPTDLKRYYLGRPADAFNLMKKFSLGITHQYFLSHQIYPTNLAGRILLDIQDSGKAYYINPVDLKPYYLGRPSDAFDLIQRFGLGITNANLNQIISSYLPAGPPQSSAPVTTLPCADCQSDSAAQILPQLAQAIRQNNKVKVLSYFTPDMQKAIEYTMNYLNAESKLILANILTGSKLDSSTAEQKIYTNEIYFSLGGYKTRLHFDIKKQADGSWKLTNL